MIEGTHCTSVLTSFENILCCRAISCHEVPDIAFPTDRDQVAAKACSSVASVFEISSDLFYVQNLLHGNG